MGIFNSPTTNIRLEHLEACLLSIEQTMAKQVQLNELNGRMINLIRERLDSLEAERKCKPNNHEDLK